jgi:hypothetical protein
MPAAEPGPIAAAELCRMSGPSVAAAAGNPTSPAGSGVHSRAVGSPAGGLPAAGVNLLVRPDSSPGPARPEDPPSQSADRTAGVERARGASGDSSPTMATMPSSWLPEPASGRASAVAAPAARERITALAGPPS